MLDATAGEATADTPKWIQIAKTALFKGYVDGQVEFTKAMFDTLVANFRANPAYVKGADGWGKTDVVPWDFNHGSENDPVSHPEAQAWTLDLDVRATSSPNTFELWSLTRVLEPAKSFIQAGKIKWASVAIWKTAVDPVSGRDIGPLLTSVAFTNVPFVQGMDPIAARLDYYATRADDAEDALCQIKGMLGMPQLADIGAVQLELAKLKMWLDQGQVPIGVDADSIVSGLRTILGLPALTGVADVFAQLGNLVPALVEQQKAEAAEGAGGSNLPAATGASMLTNNARQPQGADQAMEPKDLLLLTTTLGVSTDLSPTAQPAAIIKAAKQGADAQTKLAALLKALGVEDSDGAIGKVASMLKQASELEAAMPELKSLREDKAKKDAADEEGEVDDAIAAHRLPAQVKDALILLRRSNVAKFREQYPLPKPGERHLSKSLFATSKDGQLGSEESGARTRLTAIPGGRSDAGDPTEDELKTLPGRNIHEQAQSFVKAHVAGGDKLAFEQVHEEASKLLSRIRTTARGGARR
jgi:hypothetical protein